MGVYVWVGGGGHLIPLLVLDDLEKHIYLVPSEKRLLCSHTLLHAENELGFWK